MIRWLRYVALGLLVGGMGLEASQGWWLFVAIQAVCLAVLAYCFGLIDGRQQGRMVGYALGHLSSRVDRADFDYLMAQLPDD